MSKLKLLTSLAVCLVTLLTIAPPAAASADPVAPDVSLALATDALYYGSGQAAEVTLTVVNHGVQPVRYLTTSAGQPAAAAYALDPRGRRLQLADPNPGRCTLPVLVLRTLGSGEELHLRWRWDTSELPPGVYTLTASFPLATGIDQVQPLETGLQVPVLSAAKTH